MKALGRKYNEMGVNKKMVVFSGTNLPPILRLGGSSDLIASIPEDTAGIKLPPKYIPSSYVIAGTVKLPMSIVGKADRKGRIKAGGRQRNPRAFSTAAHAKGRD